MRCFFGNAGSSVLPVLAAVLVLSGGCGATSHGDRLLRADRPEEAAVTYAQLDGDGAALHSKLGLSFLRSGLPGAAEREWLRAMELAPKDPSSHFWLGLLASEVGDSARARGYWEEYLRLRPAASAALGRSSGDRSRYPLPWEVFRVEEEASLIHPERSRGRRLLVAISAQVDGSGQESAPGEEWDLRVTDADSWAFGAAGLPEFPPPPGGR